MSVLTWDRDFYIINSSDFFSYLGYYGNYISVNINDSIFIHVIDATPSLAKLSVLRAAGGKKIQIIKRLAPNWRGLGILLDWESSWTSTIVVHSWTSLRKHIQWIL